MRLILRRIFLANDRNIQVLQQRNIADIQLRKILKITPIVIDKIFVFNIVIQSAFFCWCKESYMLNVCCFCTDDLAVNLTEKPGSQNVDKDPTWLPTLMFLFIRSTGKIWQLKWKEKIKSRGWEKVLISNPWNYMFEGKQSGLFM